MIDTASIAQFITLLAAICAAIVALLTFRRAGAWRMSDDGKRVDGAITRLEAAVASEGGVTLKEDIHTIKNKIAMIEGRFHFLGKTTEEFDRMKDRVTAIETTLDQVASSADVRELKAEMAGINRTVGNTQAGVTRIENWLVEKGGGK